MKAFRLATAAVALAFVAGMQNDAQAEGWYVRVEVKNQFTGQTVFPTLYSAKDKKDAYNEAAWFELLMKVYPQKFQSDVLAPLGYGWWWRPQRIHVVYLSGINPTGYP